MPTIKDRAKFHKRYRMQSIRDILKQSSEDNTK